MDFGDDLSMDLQTTDPQTCSFLVFYMGIKGLRMLDFMISLGRNTVKRYPFLDKKLLVS